MTSAPARPRLVELDGRDLADRLGEALHIYVTAMGYPPGTARQRRGLWIGPRPPAGLARGRLARPGGPAARHRLRLHRGPGPVVVRGGPPRPARRPGGLDRRLLRAHRAARAARRPGRRARRGPAAGAVGRDRPRPRPALDARARPPAAGPRMAALPAPRLPRRAARAPVHRRLPALRRARPHAAAQPAGCPARPTPAATQPPRPPEPPPGPPGLRRRGGWHHGPVPSPPSVRRALTLALALLLALCGAERLRARPGRAGRAARRHRERRGRRRDAGNGSGRRGSRDHRARGDQGRRRGVRLPPGGLRRVAPAVHRPDVRPARAAVRRRGTGRAEGPVRAAAGRQPPDRDRQGRPHDGAGRPGRLPAEDHDVRRGAGDQRRRRRRHGQLDLRRRARWATSAR